MGSWNAESGNAQDLGYRKKLRMCPGVQAWRGLLTLSGGEWRMENCRMNYGLTATITKPNHGCSLNDNQQKYLGEIRSRPWTFSIRNLSANETHGTIWTELHFSNLQISWETKYQKPTDIPKVEKAWECYCHQQRKYDAFHQRFRYSVLRFVPLSLRFTHS